MSIGQNIGMALTALLPSLFAAMAPPGTQHIPMLIGSATLLITGLAAIAAWTARETFRTPLHELGRSGASTSASPDSWENRSEPGQSHVAASKPR
jgi:hypothetical protein